MNQVESKPEKRMDNFNLDELMDLAEAYVGPMVDAIYRRLMDRDFALEDPTVIMLLTALINILAHDNRGGNRPTEVLLMAAYGERELNLAPMRMRGRAELPQASLILNSVKQELTVGGTLRTRTFLAPFGCEDIKRVHGEEEDKSAGILIVPKFP